MLGVALKMAINAVSIEIDHLKKEENRLSSFIEVTGTDKKGM